VRFGRIRRSFYLRLISLTAVLGGCSVYGPDLLPDGAAAATTGAGGTAIDSAGGSGGEGGSEDPDASPGGSGGSTGGTGGSSGGQGGSGGGNGGSGATTSTGGSAGNSGNGGADPDDASATGGSAGTGGAAGTDATTGTGGATGESGGSSGAAGIDGGTAGSGGATAGAGGSGDATGGKAGAAGATDGSAGAAGGVGGSAGGTGGAKDAAPEVPPPLGAVFAVGSFTKSTSTGSQTVSHTLGQAPKALILWTVGKTNESLSSGFYYGIGISDSSTSVSLAMSTRDGASTSSTSRRVANKAITLVQGGETTVAEADLPSMSAGNFQLTWTTNDGQPSVIHYLVIGGPQVTAKIVNWQAPTSPGQKTVNGVGFQPEAVLHFHVGSAFTSSAPNNQASGVIGIGAMDKSGAEWSIQAGDADSQNPSVTGRAQRTNAAIYMYTDSGTASVTKEAKFVSMNSGGFTLDFTTANSSASQVYSLALGGLKADVGSFNKSTGTAPASQSVNTGFSPSAVFMASYQKTAESSSVNESDCSFGLGASDGTNEASSAIVATDGDSPAKVDGQDKTSKAFIKMNTPPLDAEADMASFGPSGFTLNWTTNDNVAAQICYLALGPP